MDYLIPVLQKPNKQGIDIIAIIEKGKPRHGVVKSLVQNHTSQRRRSWNWNPPGRRERLPRASPGGSPVAHLRAHAHMPPPRHHGHSRERAVAPRWPLAGPGDSSEVLKGGAEPQRPSQRAEPRDSLPAAPPCCATRHLPSAALLLPPPLPAFPADIRTTHPALAPRRGSGRGYLGPRESGFFGLRVFAGIPQPCP